MKKIITSMLAIMTSIMLVFGITGCDKKPATSSATAYDVVHESYLGVVDITVNKDGKVTAIKVDEIFFPESWAKRASDGENASFTNEWTDSKERVVYAKYIRIGDKYFEAKGEVPTSRSAKPVWEEIDGDIEDLEEELKDSADVRDWYYKAVKDGEVAIVKAVGDGFEDEKDPADNDYGSMFKSESSYWPGGEEVKGWKGNIKAIEDYVKEHGAGFEIGDLDKDDETGTWWIGDVDTGASLTDFKDYMEVVKDAYQKAMKVYQ
jgi:hypothetical protein